MRFHVLVLMLSLVTCTQRRGDVIVAGSTSVEPFIEKVAEQFMEENQGITITVQGGGSSAGIQATFNRTCDIGTSSRNLKVEERGLRVIVIAVDGIAVIVHKDNPLNALSTEEIQAIFSGAITNWKALGGKDARIIAVTREEGSGTRGAFEEMVMGDAVISDACLVQDSNGAVREIIATTPQGIGYISVGLVDEREKAIAIDGVKPTSANLINCTYRFSRPFLLLVRDEPQGNVKRFIDYVLSDEAQGILQQNGLIPVREVMDD